MKLTEVRLSGVPPELDANARARLRVEPGSSTTFWRLQDESERVQELLHSAGYLEALASADLDGTVGVIEARPGPRYAWMVEGLPSAPDLNADVQRAFFEEEAIENGRARLLDEAHRRGYVKARVTAEVRGDQAARTIVFQVALGQPAVVREVTFTGAAALSSRSLLEAAGGQAALLGEPLAARERIAALYRAHHYLAAQVALPRVQESEDRGAITIDVAIDEGPQALLAEVSFEGTTRDETELADAARIETGLPFDPVPVEDAVQRIRAYYLERGFASVRVQPRLEPRETDLDLVLRIVEGQQQFVGDVVFRACGARRSRPSGACFPSRRATRWIRAPLTLLERRLLDLDVFRRAAATASADEHATITVQVREQGPYTLQYDARYSGDEGFSALVDTEVGNIAGTALALGARVRGGQDIREMRGSLHLPALGKLGRDHRSGLPPGGGLPPAPRAGPGGGAPHLHEDTERQQGFEIQQSQSASPKWDLLFGYRFKRIESLMRDFRQDISGVQASVLRESRDSTARRAEGPLPEPEPGAGAGRSWAPTSSSSARWPGVLRAAARDSLTWAQGFRMGLGNGLDEQARMQTRAVRPLDRDVPRGRSQHAARLRDRLGGPARPDPAASHAAARRC